jgi:hypothetical protein
MDHPIAPAAPRTRFFIVTTGRTGSTRLRLLLDSHPRITCHGELFGENISTLAAPGSEPHRHLLAERDRDPAGFAMQRAFAPTGADAVGFKILHQQLLTRWPGLLDALQRAQDVRVIHLVRRNGIKRFMSEYFVGTVTGKNVYFLDEQLPRIEPVVVPATILLERLCEERRQSARIRELFAGHPCHEIAYEDSLADDGPALRAVQEFLGVPPAGLTAPIRKILPDDLRQLIANFDEVAAAVQGTPFESMLAGAP